MTGPPQNRSLTNKTWSVKIGGPPDSHAVRLAADTGLHPLAAAILIARGHDTGTAARRFVGPPDLDHFHNPMMLHGMDSAVDRILRAREQGERVLVHGDYDVDGVTSAVLVTRTLQLNGIVHVQCFVPHRIDDGYGLGRSAAERAVSDGCTLLVAVDCGTSDLEAVQHLRDSGVDVVILDHHLPGSQLPQATALVNPKQPGCSYPFKDLCSAGLALKLSQALHIRLGKTFNASAYASMAALGTVADLVPLIDENRLIVRLGLDHLRHPSNIGMRELLRICRVEPGQAPTAGQIGFGLAPRINAAGRLASADLAATLFLSADPGKAGLIARKLDLLNTRRQTREKDLVEQLYQQVEATPRCLDQRILVLSGKDWPRGVIGIAASRLVDTYHLPAVVISIDGDVGHGSCRSVPGFNITAALESAASGVLDRFGGHTMAAGFSLAASNIPRLRNHLFDHCRKEVDPELLVPRASADIEVHPADLNRSLLDALNLLEPFGMGNPRPQFMIRGLSLAEDPVSLKGQHLKLKLKHSQGAIEAIWWRSGQYLEPLKACTGAIDVLAKLELNSWAGRETLRLTLSDVRPASTC